MSGFLNTWFFVASFIPWLLIDRIGRRPLLLSMIFVMASVMVVQSALIYQVQNHTAIAHTSGIGAAAMLFLFMGAFTVGFQATVWVSSSCSPSSQLADLSRSTHPRFYPCDFDKRAARYRQLRIGSSITLLCRSHPPESLISAGGSILSLLL